MEKPTPYDPERITLSPGSGVGESSQARGSGRFAWHHEARVVSWMGREKAPRLILRRPGCNLWVRPRPTDAARAHPPEPQATNGDSVKVKGDTDEIETYQ